MTAYTEFWRIRGLVETTAYGVRGSRRISGAGKPSNNVSVFTFYLSSFRRLNYL